MTFQGNSMRKHLRSPSE